MTMQSEGSTPRLRMIAGPNGSGKSTSIRAILDEKWFGKYLNPDEIQKEIEQTNSFIFSKFDIHLTQKELSSFFEKSGLLHHFNLPSYANQLRVDESSIDFSCMVTDENLPYYVSVFADFLRRKFLEAKISFTFETVMSSFDKVEFLETARQNGYRTYLYFVSAEDPAINIGRVKERVENNGHDVPEDKIVERYYRTMKNLVPAIQHSNRAYLFDNSGQQSRYIAEFSKENDADSWDKEYHVENLPAWVYRYLPSEWLPENN